ACLIPLTRKQLKSSRAMQELQPRLKQLKEQYRNNPQEMMAAQQALYKEHGVNPVSGCLPLVIQLPFIYALYGAFENVIFAHGSLSKINGDLYSFVPHLTHLPETGFLWANLATPDPLHILPILAAIFTFLQLRMALPVRKPAAAGQKDSMTQATGMMQYAMPIMTLVIGLNFPAGLCLYWCVSTMFSAVQQYFLTGVGSLFVGIPGLEHLVPAPKEIATITPSRSISAGSARALTAPTSAGSEPSGGGLRGMLRQLKEQMSAASQNAIEAQKAKQNGTAPGGPGTTNAQNAAKTATASSPVAQKPAATQRRPRPQQKPGAVLVKPSSANGNGANPAKTATETSGASGDLPEVAIARDASGPAPFEGEPLPEAKIATLAGNGNGNGNGGKNGNVPAASGTRSGAGTSSGNRSGGQRKQSSNNSSKGSQSARPRSGGRPKGGR
ncbi:MAG TPA: membrane protein insertase YidC, partial [Ktedonobacterales bacterium]|nr:membrane protein insertase YidC [Ktedonobacterales bacterium]